MVAEDAPAKSQADIDALLPAGQATPNHLFYTAHTGEGLVGWAWLALFHPKGTPGAGWLYDIEIDSASQGSGLGRRLLRAVEDHARSHGMTGLGLSVVRRNTVALTLYESAGFETVSHTMYKRL